MNFLIHVNSWAILEFKESERFKCVYIFVNTVECAVKQVTFSERGSKLSDVWAYGSQTLVAILRF